MGEQEHKPETGYPILAHVGSGLLKPTKLFDGEKWKDTMTRAGNKYPVIAHVGSGIRQPSLLVSGEEWSSTRSKMGGKYPLLAHLATGVRHPSKLFSSSEWKDTGGKLSAKYFGGKEEGDLLPTSSGKHAVADVELASKGEVRGADVAQARVAVDAGFKPENGVAGGILRADM